MVVGVYLIRDPRTGESLYVGQSANVIGRKYAHRSALRTGRAYKPFYRWFLETGMSVDQLEFVTLVECEDEQEVKNYLEILMFDKYKPKFYGVPPSMTYRPGKAKHSPTYKDELKTCRVCGGKFKSITRETSLCSPKCRVKTKPWEVKRKCVVCTREVVADVKDVVMVCTECAEFRRRTKPFDRKEATSEAVRMKKLGVPNSQIGRFVGYNSNTVRDMTTPIVRRAKEEAAKWVSGKTCPCGRVIYVKSSRCSECASKSLEVIDWPVVEQLVIGVQAQGFAAYSRELGVSPPTLRKRLTRHGVDPKGIKRASK